MPLWSRRRIFEPTYFAYYNDRDYIHIGQNVYTRAEVNQNEYGQLDRIYPQSCVDRQASPPVLKPECFNPTPLDMTFTVASDTSSKTITVEGIPVQRFLRVAILQDTGPQDQRIPATLAHRRTAGTSPRQFPEVADGVCARSRWAARQHGDVWFASHGQACYLRLDNSKLRPDG